MTLELARLATEADGVAPFNEASMRALRDEDRHHLRVHEYDEIVAAVAVDDAPVECVVHPRYRLQGRGRALVETLIERGETRFWAHGDLPAAQHLALGVGLSPQRTLLVLRQAQRPAPGDRVSDPAVTIRPFAEADVEAIIAVNAAAFAQHPEQGRMDRADFEARRAEEWFDPAGLFVAEIDGRVAGFHWTKREGDLGEVYVVGVDPAAHGRGLGTALTDHGVQFLWDRGVSAIELYVEGDNAAALGVYRRLGFTEHARDTLYALD